MIDRPLTLSVSFMTILVMVPTTAVSQSFYESMPVREMYSPVQRDDGQIFNLNPAVGASAGNKVGGYILKRERSSTLKLADDTATTTKTDLEENGYGAGAMFDLGAGTAAGVTAERQFSTATINVNSSSRGAVERMTTQALTGRILIDVAQGLRVGLALRFMNERGDILGNSSVSNEVDRVKYDGSLVGHGGGVQYAVDNIAVGAAYYPAARGKTEIISEERIITEPGVALVDVRLKADKNFVGLGVERAVHRRDERAVLVTSEDGNRTLALDGISPDKNTFATQAIHGALDWSCANNLSLQIGVAQREREWVFSGTSVPGDNGDADKYTFMEWAAALHVTAPMDAIAGFRMDSYDTKLSGRSGNARNAADYKAGGKTLFVSVGSKF